MKKIIVLITALVFLLFASSCEKRDISIMYLFVNSTSQRIEFLFPKRFPPDFPFYCGDMHDISPNDTTSSSAAHVGFHYFALAPQERWAYESGFDTIEEMSPYDTVRFFVFDGSYYDSPQFILTEVDAVHESENYYCRYDLTSKDLHSLTDSNGDIVIEFPPSEKMKGMKMFPAYEEVRKTFCK